MKCVSPGRTRRQLTALALALAILTGGHAGRVHGQFHVGGELGKLGGQASDAVKTGGGDVSDYLKQRAGAAEHAAAKLNPSARLLREFREAQARAIRGLRWLNAGLIVQELDSSPAT